ncbi:hypothetical protein BDV26DRAFT_14104 [Aspergillus bertholletiae]|uniref:Uncharacterized protein n=1 Tax=Aspergillus bertholletiae TaxID=1226010 RepID=A0A5N7B0B1_9EURO|nr:hypothetical protein BDV26DRAFT_14104 [Aspergillus bertholletiae]
MSIPSEYQPCIKQHGGSRQQGTVVPNRQKNAKGGIFWALLWYCWGFMFLPLGFAFFHSFSLFFCTIFFQPPLYCRSAAVLWLMCLPASSFFSLLFSSSFSGRFSLNRRHDIP